MRGYDHNDIERRAKEKWEALNLYTTDLEAAKDPYYLLFEFPYPSGDLHLGHWYAYALTDIYARYKRMQGKDVLFPIGFDSFGLPAENAAMKHGLDPKEWTYKNMDHMREQIRSMGISVDWSKEVVSSDPEYYKWTQWLFAKLYEHKLAERREASVKWCPKDQTVLANEQVIDGTCERCGSEIEEKRLTQWFFKITDYAERLLKNLDALPWREEIKEAQRAWIGKSEGAKLTFSLAGRTESIEVFTTRPDTLYGATYVVLAPEHPLIEELLPSLSNTEEVTAYRTATTKKTERERSENKDKTGVQLLGIMAINPATKEEIPVYAADYVLASYGTGAVMAVPAHDERDFAFTKKFALPIRPVVMQTVINEHNPPIPGMPDTKRDVIHAILHNPKNDTYLVGFLKDESWGDRKPVNFVIGGVDEGEEWEAAAAREIREETGYQDFSLKEELSYQVNAYFHQAQKGVNRDSDIRTFVYTLNSEERSVVDAAEESKHEFKWLAADEVAKHLNVPTDQLIWRYLTEGGFAVTEPGRLVNSGPFSGRESEEAKWEIAEAAGGERVTNYRIRDWLVSRQRYWGCPIPVVYDPEGKPRVIPAEHLPWLLPTDVDFRPTGKAPLASSKELHERVTRIFGEGWTPEYDTLDTFVDSSWYFFRYLDPKDDHDFTDQGMAKKWLPIDRYSGGSEHTTLHLLYARFFTMALYDLALSPVEEPFLERFNRGLITGPDGQKMSKSKGNVVNPDECVKKFGADAVRMYLAFIGPYNEPGHYPWKPDGVVSMRKFLDRIVKLGDRVAEIDPDERTARALATAIVKVSQDTERFKFNTAIAALMTLVKEIESLSEIPKETYRSLVTLLAPFAPHLCEHLFESLACEGSVHQGTWPEVDNEALALDTVVVTVQVNGKKRGEVSLAPEASEQEALEAAYLLPAVTAALGDAPPSRTVYVKGRIINLVSS